MAAGITSVAGMPKAPAGTRIAGLIREARRARGLSLAAAGAAARLNPQRLYCLESQYATWPRREELARLADALGFALGDAESALAQDRAEDCGPIPARAAG